jgi:hypothetical protein
LKKYRKQKVESKHGPRDSVEKSMSEQPNRVPEIERPPSPVGRRSRIFDVCVLVGVVLLATVPFLHKAFHVDDVYYLQGARHILEDPWRPYDFTWIAEGRVHDAFENDWSPPLFKYVLAVGLWAFGESEVMLHGIMALFTACVAGSMYAISLRFSPWPLGTTAMVVLSPLFVPSQNLMLDVPMLALGLAGIACHVWGTDRGSVGLVLLGGLLAGLAVVTKYPAFIVFPLLAAYSLFRKSWLGLPALLIAAVPLAVWCVQNWIVHSAVHFVDPVFGGASMPWSERGARGVSVLTILGSGFVPLLLIRRVSLPRRDREIILILCVVVGVVWESLTAGRSWELILQHFLFLTAGTYLLLATLSAGWRAYLANKLDGDILFLIIWLLFGWFMSIGSQFIAVRHVLWALPAAALLVTRLILPAQGQSLGHGVVIVLMGAIGLSVGLGDMEYANIQRSQIKTLRKSWAANPWPMYYLGEDAFAYYCAAAGWKPLLIETPMEPDAGLLCSSSTAWALTPNLRSQLIIESRIRNRGQFPATTMAYGVNFYRTGTSDVPWAFGRPSEVYLDYYFLKELRGEQP